MNTIIIYLGKINQMHSKKFKRSKRKRGKDQGGRKIHICLISLSEFQSLNSISSSWDLIKYSSNFKNMKTIFLINERLLS